MDSLELLRIFVDVATSSSFSRAADRLGASKAKVSKAIVTLEDRFGVRLLNRNTRSVSLTEAGELLLERSAPILELAANTQAELENRAATPKGRLRITAPHSLDLTVIPEVINTFLARHPEVSISLLLTNREVDLAAEAVDIALRVGPAGNENLIGRKLLRMKMAVCASPLYWRQHRAPQHPEELSQHGALVMTGGALQAKWRFNAQGEAFDVAVSGRLESTEAGPLVRAALQGVGVAYLPVDLIQPYLDSGRLVQVLPEFARNDLWLSAMYLQRRNSTAVQRAFLNFLETQMQSAPAQPPTESMTSSPVVRSTD